jgi:hypothetical protein
MGKRISKNDSSSGSNNETDFEADASYQCYKARNCERKKNESVFKFLPKNTVAAFVLCIEF